MDKLFGIKKVEEQKGQQQPEVKQIKDMNKEELNQAKRDFKKRLNKEVMNLDKEIYKIDNLRAQSLASLKKELSKKDKADKFVAKVYAKQVTQADSQKNRYLTSKTQVQAMSYTIDTFFGTIKMQKIMASSTEVFKEISKCIKLPELNATMSELAQQMMKMGIIQEEIDSTMSQIGQDPQIDNESEVDKLIAETEKQIAIQQQPLNVNINNPVQQNQVLNQQQNQVDINELQKQLEINK
eukprot:TRINITY_DN19906_c0_g1_i1.p1 TRINITY_DN19906_c0_g1~~TRINITY_DN19906_c0_g1_i1.p1  ORF type:complete len:239 (+),score=71.34 TRINITY_DN19906_c0_g1_i1:202-918(+)